MMPLLAMQLGLQAPYPCRAPDSVRQVHQCLDPNPSKTPELPASVARPVRPGGVTEKVWRDMERITAELVRRGPTTRAVLGEALGLSEEVARDRLSAMKDLGLAALMKTGRCAVWAATTAGVMRFKRGAA